MEVEPNTELEAHTRPIIADLISLEPMVARYSELMRSFRDDWSGLKTTTNILKYIIEHIHYGSVLTNYTFGEQEERVYDSPLFSGAKVLVVRKPYPDLNAGALFALHKMMIEFPPNADVSLIIPSHKAVPQAKKIEMGRKKDEILLCLETIKKVISKYERLRPHLDKLVKGSVVENQQYAQNIAVVQNALEKFLK